MRSRLFLFAHVLLAVCLSLAGLSCLAQRAMRMHFSDVAGEWKLLSIYRTSNVQGPSGAVAKRLLGTKITYGAHEMTSCGMRIPILGVEEQVLRRYDLLQNEHGRFNELGLHRKTNEEITMEQGDSAMCLGEYESPGRLILVKSRNELIVDFEGVFYRAVRLR